MNKYRVMVVDDSVIAQRKIAQLLEELGHAVVCSCSNGKEACEKYPEHNPDLVTMDITMPVMDGIQATKHIISADPEAIVLMVTSHSQKKTVIDAIDAGAKGYILKPFYKDNVAEKIKQIADKYLK